MTRTRGAPRASPIAWFRTEAVADGITLLTEPHIDVRCSSPTCGTCAGATPTCVVDAANGIGPLRPFVAPLAGGRP